MTTTKQQRLRDMRENRDLWVRRHMQLEELIKTIRRQIERFEEGVEPKDDWTFEVGADDMQAIGWARVLCDMAFNPPPTMPRETPEFWQGVREKAEADYPAWIKAVKEQGGIS